MITNLVFRVLSRLREALFAAVQQAIGNETCLAVAFSGGVDSALLAKICKDIGISTTLLTVGFSGSKDSTFSREVAGIMNMPHKIFKLDSECFQKNVNYVSDKIGCNITSHIENCVAFFYIARLARDNGFRYVVTANGCDELFCGYDTFRSVYDQGCTALMNLQDKKLENEFVLMQEIDSITEEFGITVKQPFLSPDFISFAKSIPIDQKISGPKDEIRKHILRQVASLIGVPRQSVMQRKMALQYSSLIHKNFCKVSRDSLHS